MRKSFDIQEDQDVQQEHPDEQQFLEYQKKIQTLMKIGEELEQKTATTKIITREESGHGIGVYSRSVEGKIDTMYDTIQVEFLTVTLQDATVHEFRYPEVFDDWGGLYTKFGNDVHKGAMAIVEKK
jgi:hypothetical protein